MIPQDFIEQLKLNNPIETVMADYVRLKRSSRGYVCLCPFHSEKTPSCHVNTGKQFFHCFGCGAGGDVITFVMKAENLEYIEAIKLLAARAGMSMPDSAESDNTARLKSRIYEINRMAAKYYHDILMHKPQGEKGRLYFKSRALMPKTIVKYGLGYAPDGWRTLCDYLKANGCTEDELTAANLCRKSEKGGIYDAFRDRVIFPIIDLRGNVIAFGGRVIDGEGPKYLNSSDTLVFKKSRNLFSLNFAKRSQERRLILAEGYMDVIAINQGGFENVVATLGTALTPEQARLMSTYADEVIISYDSDAAGQNATHRAINLLSEAGVRTRIIKMEGAKDPDEFIKKFGAARFRQLLDNSDGAVNFELQKCGAGIDTQSDTGRVEYLRKCVGVLASINSPIERSVYISKLAKEQDISREALEAQVESVIKKQRRRDKKQEWNDVRSFSERRKADPEAVRMPREYKAEQGIIAYLSMHPDSLENIAERLPEEYFVTEFNRRVYSRLIYGMRRSPDFNILSLQSEFSADEMGKITAILSEAQEIEPNAAAADDYIAVLAERAAASAEKKPPSELSNDDFRNFAKALKSRK